MSLNLVLLGEKLFTQTPTLTPQGDAIMSATDKSADIKTRGSKMPQKAGCAGSNKVSDCCNYI